jgi:sec-independent protein translocase protein TatB
MSCRFVGIGALRWYTQPYRAIQSHALSLRVVASQAKTEKDAMFGIGAQEIVIILIVALIVVGPQRLPEVAGQVAKAIRDFRRMSDELTGEFTRSLSLDDDPKPNPLLTDEVITASSTPDQVGSSIAQSLRIETIPNETVTPALPATVESAATNTDTSDAVQANGAALNEDTVISLAPIAPTASKSDPLIGVSLLDRDATYVGATYPTKAPPTTSDYVYEASTTPTAAVAVLETTAAVTAEAETAQTHNGISDAWDAVISTEATASPVVAEVAAIDESAPDVINEYAYVPPTREQIDPGAEVTIREKIEAQVAAEAFRERRRIASYQRSRKRG